MECFFLRILCMSAFGSVKMRETAEYGNQTLQRQDCTVLHIAVMIATAMSEQLVAQ